jgi:hypothetical protein
MNLLICYQLVLAVHVVDMPAEDHILVEPHFCQKDFGCHQRIKLRLSYVGIGKNLDTEFLCVLAHMDII